MIARRQSLRHSFGVCRCSALQKRPPSLPTYLLRRQKQIKAFDWIEQRQLSNDSKSNKGKYKGHSSRANRHYGAENNFGSGEQISQRTRRTQTGKLFLIIISLLGSS